MPGSVHSQDPDQSMVDAEQPEQEVVSNDPILEERQIVVVRHDPQLELRLRLKPVTTS